MGRASTAHHFEAPATVHGGRPKGAINMRSREFRKIWNRIAEDGRKSYERIMIETMLEHGTARDPKTGKYIGDWRCLDALQDRLYGPRSQRQDGDEEGAGAPSGGRLAELIAALGLGAKASAIDAEVLEDGQVHDVIEADRPGALGDGGVGSGGDSVGELECEVSE